MIESSSSDDSQPEEGGASKSRTSTKFSSRVRSSHTSFTHEATHTTTVVSHEIATRAQRTPPIGDDLCRVDVTTSDAETMTEADRKDTTATQYDARDVVTYTYTEEYRLGTDTTDDGLLPAGGSTAVTVAQRVQYFDELDDLEETASPLNLLSDIIGGRDLHTFIDNIDDESDNADVDQQDEDDQTAIEEDVTDGAATLDDNVTACAASTDDDVAVYKTVVTEDVTLSATAGTDDVTIGETVGTDDVTATGGTLTTDDAKPGESVNVDQIASGETITTSNVATSDVKRQTSRGAVPKQHKNLTKSARRRAKRLKKSEEEAHHDASAVVVTQRQETMTTFGTTHEESWTATVDTQSASSSATGVTAMTHSSDDVECDSTDDVTMLVTSSEYGHATASATSTCSVDEIDVSLHQLVEDTAAAATTTTTAATIDDVVDASGDVTIRQRAGADTIETDVVDGASPDDSAEHAEEVEDEEDGTLLAGLSCARLCCALLPLLLLLLLLLLWYLLPLFAARDCGLANNFERSFRVMLIHKDGAPPV